MQNREMLKSKIRALKAKTKRNGCTEAEALAAAELAAKLMKENGLSDEGLQISEKASRTNKSGTSSIGKLWIIIAWCTNSRCIILDYEDGSMVNFVGNDPGPEIACYLRDVCERAIASEHKRFRESAFYKARRKPATKRAASQDFIDGMVIRLINRLHSLFEDSHSEKQTNLAEKAIQETYSCNVPVTQAKRKGRYSEAASRGFHAGGKVTLNHGVNGDENTSRALLT